MRPLATEFDRVIHRGAVGGAGPRTERCKGFQKNGCAVRVPQYSGRCGECQQAREDYAAGSFGLDDLVAKRLHNEALGLCLFCGSARKAGGRLCSECEHSTKERDFVLTSYRAKRTPNPYKNVFDRVEDHEESDGQMVLVPDGETMAMRAESTARHWQAIADWEFGPRARDAARKARIHRQVAVNMRAYHNNVKKMSR